MSGPTQHRLAALVSADVVGYPRLKGQDEATTLASSRAETVRLTDDPGHPGCAFMDDEHNVARLTEQLIRHPPSLQEQTSSFDGDAGHGAIDAGQFVDPTKPRRFRITPVIAIS